MDMTSLKPTRPKRVTPSGTWYKEFRTRYFDFTAKHLYGVISVKALVQVV